MAVSGWSSRSLLLAGAVALFVVACSSSDGSVSGTTRPARPPASAATPTTTVPPDGSDAAPRTTTVFRSGDGGYDTFRIPAVVTAADGALLAFAEGRKASAADDGEVDLVVKRSTDLGRTWGPAAVVASDDADFVGNPSPVVDGRTGRVVVLAIRKDGRDSELEITSGTGVDSSRVWLLMSDDDGRTWSPPRDITTTVKRPEWRWYAVGPGHAVQLRAGEHAGRLVAAANHSDATRGQGGHALYSDDGGLTWSIGADDTPGLGRDSPNESTAAELPDGTIVFSSRNQDEAAPWHRLRTTSSDGGLSFTAPYAQQVGLTVPVVQGSLLWVGGRDGRLLFSAPASRTERVDLTVRGSTDAGETWSEGTRIASGPSAYSDLVGLPGGLVGVLHEAGTQAPTERIDLTVIGVDRIG